MEKKDQVLFIIGTTVLNVFVTFIITAALIGFSFVLMKFAFKVDTSSMIFAVVMIAAIFIGMILSFFVYTKIAKIIINKKYKNQ